MRLWSLHPRHLDRQGLTGCWRETLLAQAVLAGRTRGYRSHPQLERFRAQAEPLAAIGEYLEVLAEEALARGYRFDRSRIDHRPAGAVGDGADAGEASPGAPADGDRHVPDVPRIRVTSGQLDLEWRHLLHKLEERSPERWERASALEGPTAHPLFEVVPGPVESWERAEDPQR
ncbi:pyrimidine dimer DNA glycosylase/endonuclease V [Brachybacterium sp. GU-2]|uniref:pyrimidine dimer DNA glycosylase/endonuclease V n=1 Tax=Brachybacterium sp. GU-2 TaxID=3069708 RepID=UPI00280B5AC5|nr:pyrimidine dimer DNA glycosylase/endonuclease V [Brachybacterium sp. GU-2]WME24223.1 pyrimidine dimer DNA glycosylase/endonuclease V [Brachybacterium sp. GU-2]